MSDNVTQSDWKKFKVIRERALERLCERALDDLARVAADASATYHERYLEVFEKIKDYDKQLADGFDDLSRSRMLEQIAFLRSLKHITDDEMADFSQPIQAQVAKFVSF
jgi:nucleotidyltransferase/DNA polymerase involved in DNA repair